MASSSLPLFWSLASPAQATRLGASDALLTALLAQQRALPARPLDNANDPAPYTTNHAVATLEETERTARRLDGGFASEVGYAVRRLVKGLASPRESARLGFAVALTELLSQLPSLPASDVLVLLLQHSPLDSTRMSGREERANLFARLFGVEALVRSGALFRTNSDAESFVRTAEILLDLSAHKAWLKEGAGWCLCELLARLGESAEPWKDEARTWFIRRIGSVEMGPEKLAMLLQLRSSFPETDVSAVLAPLKGPEIFAPANLPTLARILKNASPAPPAESETTSKATGKTGAQNGTGLWKAQVHFVWTRVLDAYFASEQQVPSRAPFSELYRVVVDESLFAASASAERKAWGFQVFQMAVPRAPRQERPLLFTSNFMRTWINQLGGKERMLHAAAVQTVRVVTEVVKKDPTSGFTVVSQLLGSHGSQYFDKLTGTKTVEGLLAAMDAQGVRDYIGYLVRLACETDDAAQSQSAGARRKWVFDQLLVLVRNGAVPKDDDCVQQILSFFAAHGFFELKKAKKNIKSLEILPQPAFAPELRSACRARFLSCLSELADQTTVLSDVDGKVRKAQGCAASGKLWVAQAWDLLASCEKDAAFLSIVQREEADVQMRARASKALTSVRKLADQAKEAAVRDRARSFESLLLAALLVTYDGDDDGEDLLEPLIDCSERLFAPASKPKDADEPEAIELLVDCLIAFLERSSAFLRTIASQAFTTFASELTAASLDHLIDQLGLNEEPADDEEMEDAAPADVEALDEEMSETSADSIEEGSDSDEDADDDDANVEADPELRAAVEAALKAAGIADESEASGGEESEEEDEKLLDDEQMMQIDDQLAEIFRQRAGAKKEDAEAKREAVVFQLKTLDLLDIFARKEGGSALAVRLVAPLFTLVQETDKSGAQVSSRASHILRSSLAKNKVHAAGVSVADVLPTLRELHAVARRNAAPELQSLASTTNAYLSRTVFARGEEALPAEGADELLALYRETLGDFLSRKSCALRPAFLLDVLRRCPTIGWELRGDLVAAARPEAATNAFRLSQTLAMLQAVLTHAASAAPRDAKLTRELAAFLPDVSGFVLATLTAAAAPDAPTGLRAERLKELLKFALAAARLTRRADAALVERVWKPAKVAAAREALAASERFAASTGLIALLRQLEAVAGAPAAPEGKRSAAGGVDREAPGKKRKAQ